MWFIKITLQHGCSSVNLLHIFRTPFTKSTSRRLLLNLRGWFNDEQAPILYETRVFLAKLLIQSLLHKSFYYIFLVIFLKGTVSRPVSSFQYLPCQNFQSLSLRYWCSFVERLSTWINWLGRHSLMRANWTYQKLILPASKITL